MILGVVWVKYDLQEALVHLPSLRRSEEVYFRHSTEQIDARWGVMPYQMRVKCVLELSNGC